MQCDIDPCDLAGSDILFISDIAGLEVYQCASWALGPSHGGIISATQITGGKDSVFGRLSLADNQAGKTNYYKTFWKNAGADWGPVRAEVVMNSSSQFARESVALALGTSTDDMTNKPNDSSFLRTTETVNSVVTGGNIPIWIRQIVTAGGPTAERGQDIQVQILLTSAE